MNPPAKLEIHYFPYPSVDELANKLNAGQLLNAEDLGAYHDPTEENSKNITKDLVSIIGQVWRLGTIVTDPETGEPRSELSDREIRKLSNAIEGMQESIQNLGIRVIDRCNEDFHPGLPDKVVTEEPQEGISKERIIRTIRPTIMWHQTMVQRGEIDIAVPIADKQS